MERFQGVVAPLEASSGAVRGTSVVPPDHDRPAVRSGNSVVLTKADGDRSASFRRGLRGAKGRVTSKEALLRSTTARGLMVFTTLLPSLV